MPPSVDCESDEKYAEYSTARRQHWDVCAGALASLGRQRRCYHQRLAHIYRLLIPPGQSVLEVGCGNGGLLAALEPARGVGVDFSEAMLEHARRGHPELTCIRADAHELDLDETFDAIILSDLLNDLWDVQRVLQRIRPLCTPRTRIVMNLYSRVWQGPLRLAETLGRKLQSLQQNWLTVEDVANLLHLERYEMIRSWHEILLPLRVPGLDTVCNRFLVKLWPFCLFGLTNMLVARPQPDGQPEPSAPKVTVVVPARNEEENIPGILDRVPEMGAGTEVVFVEGHSQDDTYAAIEREMDEHPDRQCRLIRQPGEGKADAVHAGFAEAEGDVFMILDADLTVPPEALPRFFEVLRTRRAEFVNGVRLVYPMERRAMRFCNLVGNKFFGLAFSWLIGQNVKDTLCGTKALWRSDYELIQRLRSHFGDFDPFGDFELLFGAAKLNLKIADLPVRYRERVYGETNIQRWRHGLILMRMLLFAARRIRFV